MEAAGYALYNASPSVLGVNLAQAIGNVIGYSPNPFPGAWYVGPDLRQFQFSWIFVPESREDSSKIKRIINQIRKRTLSEPTGQLSAFLKYPEICRIRLHPDKLRAVFPFKECALTGINVDYSPYGLSFHNDQNPTAIGLGLVFAEIRPLFRTDFDNDPENTDLSSEYKDLTSQDVKDAFDPAVFAR